MLRSSTLLTLITPFRAGWEKEGGKEERMEGIREKAN